MQNPIRQSPAAIKAEMELLIRMKPKVRHYTAFGDDNRDKIQAQIDVLAGLKHSHDFYDDYEDDDEATEIVFAAMEAEQWVEGSEPEAPSKGWEHLLTEPLEPSPTDTGPAS